MRRFKKGDKVVCKVLAPNLKKGAVYEVLDEFDKDETDYFILIKNENGNKIELYEYRFVKYINKKNHLPIWF